MKILNSEQIIAKCVREFWKDKYPQDVVIFFEQKYDFENEWNNYICIAFCESDTDYDNITFLYDFCEGQTDVKNIYITPLTDVLSYFYQNKILDYKLAEELNNGNK